MPQDVLDGEDADYWPSSGATAAWWRIGDAAAGSGIARCEVSVCAEPAGGAAHGRQ